MAKITRAEFDAIARNAGLTLSELQKAELYGAWGTLEQLIERMKAPTPPLALEPATIFDPDKSR